MENRKNTYTEDSIKSLDWKEHIRTRPGMYIGKLGDGSAKDDGIYVLIKEVIDNSIDEHLMGHGKVIKIKVKDYRVEVRDYGRGIPLGKVIDCVSKINTGGKYDSEAFQKSVGLNGVGLKAVNALSTKFQIDNIHIKQTVTTYVKFGVKFAINISSSSSNYGNLTYATQITGASAQGGNAPVAFVNDLIREKGSGYTFLNNNKEYPRTNEEFLDPSLRSAIKYDEKDYEEWFNFVKKFFKKFDNNSKNYDQFHEYISGLYQQKFSTGGPPCAQTKLMTLHFFYDTLRTYSKDKEFWLRVLYLGMKVGERFAAHAKIYESGDKEE